MLRKSRSKVRIIGRKIVAKVVGATSCEVRADGGSVDC